MFYKQIVPGTRRTLQNAVSHRTASNEYRRLPLGVVSNLLMIPDVSITKREQKTVFRNCLIQSYCQPNSLKFYFFTHWIIDKLHNPKNYTTQMVPKMCELEKV
jgi:hypothetical protein